jgi:hypothetical protein
MLTVPIFTLTITDPNRPNGNSRFEVQCLPFKAVVNGWDGKELCSSSVFLDACWNVIQATNTGMCGFNGIAHVSVSNEFYTYSYYAVAFTIGTYVLSVIPLLVFGIGLCVRHSWTTLCQLSLFFSVLSGISAASLLVITAHTYEQASYKDNENVGQVLVVGKADIVAAIVPLLQIVAIGSINRL